MKAMFDLFRPLLQELALEDFITVSLLLVFLWSWIVMFRRRGRQRHDERLLD